MWEFRSICIRSHSPPPFLERGIAEIILRRVAYVPLTGIKPTLSAVCAVSVSYSFCKNVSDVLVTVTFTGSTTSSKFDFSGMSEAMSLGVSCFRRPSGWFWIISFRSIFRSYLSCLRLLGLTVEVVVTCRSLCSASKQSRDYFWDLQIAKILLGVENLMPRWYVDGTAFMEFIQGNPMITL